MNDDITERQDMLDWHGCTRKATRPKGLRRLRWTRR